MARPRLVDDDAILDATRLVLAEVGPAKLTLAAVGARVGLAPPTLMQRFGSKRGLLLASAARSTQLVLRAAATTEAANTSPLATLRDFALKVVAQSEQLDLSDPEFREHARAHAAAIVNTCARFYRAAVTAGELREETDVPALARHTLVCLNGAIQVWAVNGWGTLPAFLTEQLDLMLEPKIWAGGAAQPRDIRA
ncbi:TetR/AcrR family transcriptional regulator [Kribbella sp. NPDC056951]|uniref:TetR/AcrR family transcriptional regulator n=1 Tax=Kribbella sp. NPDC056951 TaxID=3345978 RepID=UPI003633A802